MTKTLKQFSEYLENLRELRKNHSLFLVYNDDEFHVMGVPSIPEAIFIVEVNPKVGFHRRRLSLSHKDFIDPLKRISIYYKEFVPLN